MGLEKRSSTGHARKGWAAEWETLTKEGYLPFTLSLSLNLAANGIFGGNYRDNECRISSAAKLCCSCFHMFAGQRSLRHPQRSDSRNELGRRRISKRFPVSLICVLTLRGITKSEEVSVMDFPSSITHKASRQTFIFFESVQQNRLFFRFFSIPESYRGEIPNKKWDTGKILCMSFYAEGIDDYLELVTTWVQDFVIFWEKQIKVLYQWRAIKHVFDNSLSQTE